MKLSLTSCYRPYLELCGEGITRLTATVGFETVEKFTAGNTGIAVGILSLNGTEPEIYLGSFTPPPNCNARLYMRVRHVSARS